MADDMLPFERGVAFLGDEERDAVLEVLGGRSLFRYEGPALQRRVERFERAFAAVMDVPHAVAVSSGTAALRAALAALGVGPGDEVIVPAVTFVATVNAVVVAGAVPVFADVDDSLCVDPRSVESCVTERTAAVIPVHLENVAADLDAICGTASASGIAVLEDAAQAMGVTYHGRKVGTVGDVGAFSLQLSKNVTSGEGGVVVTADERLYLRAARYQDQGGQFVTQHGARGDETGESFVGENLRMTELAGAIAEVQLRRLPDVLGGMRAAHDRIAAAVGEIDGLVPRRYPDPDGVGGSSLMWFAPDRDQARRCCKALLAAGVPAGQMYAGRPAYDNPAILGRRTASMQGPPWHSTEFPTDVEYRLGMCPVAEDLLGRSITVPIGPMWTEAECDRVASAVVETARSEL